MIPIRREWSAMKRLALLSPALAAPAVDDYATGNPVVFVTDLAKALKQLKVNFTPKQASGTPSPENVLPITGWDGLTVFGGGKNLYDKTAGSTAVWWEGSVLGDYQDYRASEKIPVAPNTKYVLSKATTGQNQLQYFDKNGDYLRQDTSTLGYLVSRFTVPADVYFIAFNIANTALDTAQLEVGETATAYEPFVPIDTYHASFPSTIYGGYVDLVSGVLTVEWARVKISDLDWQYQNNWNGRFRAGLAGKDGVDASVTANLMCDCYKSELGTISNDNIICGYGKGNSGLVYIKDSRFTDEDDFVDAVGDYYIYYPLLTPQEIQLTPQQINAIKGNNTIWSDANGLISVVFQKKK